MKITDTIEGILRSRQWGLYDKQSPLEKLNVSGEAPLFKVNEIEEAMEKEQWKNSNSDGNQENPSQNG